MKKSPEGSEDKKILYLSRADIEALAIPTADVVDCVEKSFLYRGTGKTEMPPKWGVFPRDSAFIHAMPTHVFGEEEYTGIKWIAGYASNRAKGLPFLQGLVVMNDSETGRPLAIMDCKWITDRRTAAAGIVGMKHLGPKEINKVAIIGIGEIGIATIKSVRDMYPKAQMILTDVVPSQVEHALKMCEGIPGGVKDIIVESDHEKAVKDADVILTMITMEKTKKPCIKSEWIKKGALVLTQDYDAAISVESTVADEYIVDDIGQYTYTQNSGSYFKGFPTKPTADMGEVLSGKHKPKKEFSRIVAVFQGIATHDLVTAGMIYRRALDKKIGTWLDI